MRITPHLAFDPTRTAAATSAKAGASDLFADLMSGVASSAATAAGRAGEQPPHAGEQGDAGGAPTLRPAFSGGPAKHLDDGKEALVATTRALAPPGDAGPRTDLSSVSGSAPALAAAAQPSALGPYASTTHGAVAKLETIISSKGARIAPQGRAFGLDELGMFGLRAGVEASFGASSAALQPNGGPLEPAGTPSLLTADPIAGAVASLAGQAPAAQMAQGGGSLTPPSSAGDDKAAHSGEAANSSPAVAAIGRSAAAPAAPEDHADEPAAPTAEAPGGREAPRSLPQGKSAVSVLVAEAANGAIQIVAGSPALDADSAARLRRLIDSTAAEFGKRLASVSLNGRGDDTVTPSDGGKSWR